MEIKAWPENDFNTRFFSFNEKPIDNTKTSENLSGRKVSVQINSKSLMSYSFKVKFTKTELNKFWAWFNDELGQLTNWFTCPALGSGYYQFRAIPDPQDTDLQSRVLAMEVEEVI